MHYCFDKFQVTNPKRYFDDTPLEERHFPYYAGYSESFARSLLQSAQLDPNSRTLDPWNGSGTTLRALRSINRDGTGVDLNPAMVVVGKASLLSKADAPSLVPLCASLLAQAQEIELTNSVDPLSAWLLPESAHFVRRIEVAINRSLVCHDRYAELTTGAALSTVSPLAAFYYLALFRAARRVLSEYVASNPTWIKFPESLRHKKRPTWSRIATAFESEVATLTKTLTAPESDDRQIDVLLGNSEALTLQDSSIDFVIGSPPYCTRIDYAVATAIELAVLGIDKNRFDTLRRSLMGTSTVRPNAHEVSQEWGSACATFLRLLKRHSSKASKTYYFKNHVQYFSSLFNSIKEITRVLRPQGSCVLVVQDSYYKEIHNDVPRIVTEMADTCRLRLRKRDSFSSDRSMVRLNKRATKYLPSRTNVEAVLCFERV